MAMPCIGRDDEDSGDVQWGRRPTCDVGGVRARTPTKKVGYRRMTRQVGGGAAGLNVAPAESPRRAPLDYPFARFGDAIKDGQLPEPNLAPRRRQLDEAGA
jgi:hypothetical protein